MLSRRFWFLFVLLAVVAGSLTAGCSSQSEPEAHALAMTPLSEMPAEVQAAPVIVQQAYQFAVANPEVLKELPCYCGCGAMGHTSNYACYVKEEAGGGFSYDSHALACSICVDITQDAMRLMREGKELKAIRLYVDQTYAKYGTSNMVP